MLVGSVRSGDHQGAIAFTQVEYLARLESMSYLTLRYFAKTTKECVARCCNIEYII